MVISRSCDFPIKQTAPEMRKLIWEVMRNVEVIKNYIKIQAIQVYFKVNTTHYL